MRYICLVLIVVILFGIVCESKKQYSRDNKGHGKSERYENKKGNWNEQNQNQKYNKYDNQNNYKENKYQKNYDSNHKHRKDYNKNREKKENYQKDQWKKNQFKKDNYQQKENYQKKEQYQKDQWKDQNKEEKYQQKENQQKEQNQQNYQKKEQKQIENSQPEEKTQQNTNYCDQGSCDCQQQSEKQVEEETKTYSPEEIIETVVETFRPKISVEGETCPEKATYDFNLLALSWIGEFCTQSSCVCMWDADWDGKSATVHGFWPSGSAQNYLDCFGYQGDPNCLHEAFQFNYNLFGADLKRELDIHWPEYGGKNCGEFYKYEWDKHGTCYLMNMIEDNKADYEKDPKAFNETVFVGYFQDVVNKVGALNIQLQSGKRYENKEELAKDLGLEPQQFRVKCSKDDEVDEFQVCFTRTTKVGEEVLMVCPEDYSNEGDCYNEPFYIK